MVRKCEVWFYFILKHIEFVTIYPNLFKIIQSALFFFCPDRQWGAAGGLGDSQGGCSPQAPPSYATAYIAECRSVFKKMGKLRCSRKKSRYATVPIIYDQLQKHLKDSTILHPRAATQLAKYPASRNLRPSIKPLKHMTLAIGLVGVHDLCQ